MDVSCIISSGDIELYVLGMLPPDEAARMEQLIQLFPEIREEADRVSIALGSVARSGDIEPSADLKQKVMGAIQAEPHTGSFSPLKAVRSEPDKPRSTRTNVKPLLAAASIITLVCLGALLYFITENNKNRRALLSTRQELQGIHQQEQRSASAYQSLLALATDSAYDEVALAAVPGKPAARATVYWNAASNDVYLINVSLPTPPSGKQYQLWALIDGKPADAGVLAVPDGNKSIQKMKPFSKADAFAITLENVGGSASPTLEQLYVIGNAGEQGSD